jgi:diguanylate cyclase (GGDEF)-like protein/PAS domain S-box-containing protein
MMRDEGVEVTAEDGDRALRALLERHPEALVSGVSDDGLFRPVPESVPATGHPRAQARSALDLVQSVDRRLVMEAWRRARDEGEGRVVVRLAGSTTATGVLHLIDVTATHGAFMAVLVPTAGVQSTLLEVAQILSSPPRLAVSRLDEHGIYTDVQPEVTTVLGWAPSELLGQSAIDRIHPDDHDVVTDAWMELLTRPGGMTRSRLRHLHSDGRWIWLEITNHNVLTAPGVGHVQSEMLDIAEEMQALEALQASEQLLRRLAGALPVGVVRLDGGGKLVYVNDRLHQLLGSAPDGTPEDLEHVVVEDAVLAASIAQVLAGEDVDVEVHVDPVDGGLRRHCALALRALTNPDGQVTGAVGCLTDITDDRRMRAELERRATVDAMTGCANRSSTIAFVDEVLTSTTRSAAVVFVDLDRFKAVNDRFGHAAGDDLLVAVAARLRAAVRDVDLVGRIGGDEFLVVCPDVDAREGMAIGERVLDALAMPFSLGDLTLSVSASVGIARSAAGEGSDALIARADGAMYQSKREGRRRPVLAGPPSGGSSMADELGPHLGRLPRTARAMT